ncbi:MAG: hypothetical protein V7631_3171 [Massilia sp.]|jgi:hypothetical protein
MRVKDVIGFLCIAAGIAIAIIGVQNGDLQWMAGGLALAAVGAVLVRLGRRDPDGLDD